MTDRHEPHVPDLDAAAAGAGDPEATGPGGAPSDPAGTMPAMARRFTTAPDDRPVRNQPWALLVMVGLLGWAAFSGGWSLLLVIVAIVVMIFLHELGHYVMAKRAGMKVTEFFLGFGPRLWSFRRGETEYGIKAIPAGAYVRIIGMNNMEEVDPADEPRTYRQQAFRHRLGVAVAGSTMHFIIALICIWTVLVFNGAPSEGLFREASESRAWAVEHVVEESAAARAGVQPGDKIVAVDGVEAPTYSEMRQMIVERPGRTVALTVERAGGEVVLQAELGNNQGRGFLGVQRNAPEPAAVERSNPVVAVPEAFQEFGILSWTSVKAIGEKFSPSGLADLARSVSNGGNIETSAGPVVGDGTGGDGGGSVGGSGSSGGSVEVQDRDRVISLVGAIGIGSDLAKDGWISLVFFLAVINGFIGLINLAPLLPFDGGHVVVAVYEKIRSMLQGGRPYHADISKMLPVAYGVVMVMVFVGLSTMYLDIVNPIRLN